jgi:YVTN family beta-propeller protein
VYLAEAAHSSVSALDPQSGALTTLRTGIRAAAIAADPAGTCLYVTHPDDTALTVIDVATANTVAVPVGAAPGRPVVDPDAYTIYVPARRAGAVIAIDTRTLATTTIPVGPLPYAVAIDTATRAVLCTNAGDDTVSIIERQP